MLSRSTHRIMVVLACGALGGGALGSGALGCGAAEETGEPVDSIPEAITAHAQHRGVEPWTGWTLSGVTLYRLSFAVPDRSESSIVGLDDATGAVLSGPALMRRIGLQAPELLARRVFDVLLGQQGGYALTVGDRGTFGSDPEWALVAPPRLEEGALVFFGWRGEMAPELVEHRVDTESWTVSTRTATEVLVASGHRAPVGGVRCQPQSICGCWHGCAAYQLVRVPQRSADDTVFVLVGEEDGELYSQRHDCTADGTSCGRVCRADLPDATCDDPILREEESCTEACPPTEAPYHCDLHEDGCRVVQHPVRAAAAGDRAR